MRSSKLIIAGILFFCLASISTQAQHNKTKWLDGSWTGSGYQSAALNHSVWAINLDYDFENEVIKIDYPDFPCGGYWKLVKADKNKAEFVEYIDNGKTLCNDQGKVIVTRIDENYITISYFLPELMEGVIAFSTLEKLNQK